MTYRSSSARALAFDDALREAMSPPVTDRIAPQPSDAATVAAGADVAEADAPESVTADTAVLDADTGGSYGHRVQHDFTDHSPQEWHSEAEALRQSRLRRWQAQR